jgi:hypothetical protein
LAASQAGRVDTGYLDLQRVIRGGVAIIGVGTTAQGALPGTTADEIAIDAFRLGLEDSRIGKYDVDGLINVSIVWRPHGILVGDNVRFRSRPRHRDWANCWYEP